MRSIGLALIAAACAAGPRGGGTPPGAIGARQVALTVFRDAALVHERWRVPLRDGRGTIRVPVDAGVAIHDLSVIATGGARLVGLVRRGPGPAPGDTVTVAGATGELVLGACGEPDAVARGRARCGRDVVVRGADHELHVVDARGVIEYRGGGALGAEVAITLAGTGAAASVELVYTTPRITWRAAYALIRAGDGDRARLDGAVAIENRSGVELPGALITVIDDQVGPARHRGSSELARELLGGARTGTPRGRDLGVVDVARGETRLALAAAPRSLGLEEVLVFDPIGTGHDVAGAQPERAKNHGLDGPPSTTVLRSFEIALDDKARAALPAGPVRLFGHGARGQLVLLGGGRLFDRAQADAPTATIAVGRSPDVTARRARTDYVLDEAGERLIEEFTITIDNAGQRPARVLVREHLYRGETWKLAYPLDVSRVAQEGPQQLAFRVEVPGGDQRRLVYRVVYSWR